MDWERAKVEYITNPKESYRSLAARYGVSATQVANRSREENWRELRAQHLQDVCTKTVEAIGEKRVERMTRLQGAADKLLLKLEQAIDGLDGDSLVRNAKLPRGLTGAMRDIKEILDLRADADIREQEARIERLRAGMEQEKDSGVTLVIDGGEDDWKS